MLSSLKTYAHLVMDLRRFLSNTLSVDQCKEIVRKRLEDREENFLDTVRKSIYENKSSPYLKLLEIAGCRFADLVSSVNMNGMEKTLQDLRESGVYLTYDEFKGRKDVLRSGKTFRFAPNDFNNPISFHHLTVRTGGTTGPSVQMPVDFDYISQNAIYVALMDDNYGLWGIPYAIWFPILPGSAGISSLLRNAKIGRTTEKWFSHTDRENVRTGFRHRFRTNGLLYAGRFFGAKLPKPEYVDLNNALKVAEWAADCVRDYSGCCISTYPSSAVRICHAAKERGLDIQGLRLIVVGEPLTDTKKKEIRSAGVDIIPSYGFTEAGIIGYGCAEPTEPDDHHFFHDAFALIQHRRKIPHGNQDVNAFLFTSLLQRAPKILLNVETGDYGVVESRRCGCGFEKLGFDIHLHGIRSFGKFTSEGMNLAGAHLVRVAEEILPLKYGGHSTDYQIVEEEDKEGFTRLSIVVSPTIGEIDEGDVLKTVLDALKSENETGLMPEIFSQAKTFRIKRGYPVSSERGKVFSLHTAKKRNQP